MFFWLKRHFRIVFLALTAPLLLFAVGFPGLVKAEVSGQITSFDEIDRLVEEQMVAGHIPGLALVITSGDQIVHVKGFGVTSLDDPRPVTENTIFDLASISKSFTALAILLLRDEGLIDLGQPVQRYLPDFELADPEASAQITVAQLLNHTSGLPTGTDPLMYQQGSDAMEKMVAGLGDVHLDREPGEYFEYANLNYSLLGAIVERVSGLPFEMFVQERIFDPLGLGHTTAYPDVAESLGKSDGHQPIFGFVITRNVPVYRTAVPAGWVMSSAADMGRWLIFHQNGGKLDGQQLVPIEDIEKLHQPTTTLERDNQTVGYGMGWFSFTDGNGISYIWHGGDTPNFSTEMILVPGYGLGVAMMVNSQNESLVHSLAPQIVGLMVGTDVELPSAPWWASWASLDKFASFLAAVDLFLVLALVGYIWWLRQQVRMGKRQRLTWPFLQKWRLHIRHAVLNISPLVALGLILLAIFLVARYFFGFDPFSIAVDFRLFSPPSIWWSSVGFFFAIGLWTLMLAALGLAFVKDQVKLDSANSGK